MLRARFNLFVHVNVKLLTGGLRGHRPNRTIAFPIGRCTFGSKMCWRDGGGTLNETMAANRRFCGPTGVCGLSGFVRGFLIFVACFHKRLRTTTHSMDDVIIFDFVVYAIWVGFVIEPLAMLTQRRVILPVVICHLIFFGARWGRNVDDIRYVFNARLGSIQFVYACSRCCVDICPRSWPMVVALECLPANVVLGVVRLPNGRSRVDHRCASMAAVVPMLATPNAAAPLASNVARACAMSSLRSRSRLGLSSRLASSNRFKFHIRLCVHVVRYCRTRRRCHRPRCWTNVCVTNAQLCLQQMDRFGVCFDRRC